MSLTDDVRAAEAAVLDLIDLDVATRDPTVSPQLRRRLTLMRQRREEGLPGVRLSVAASLLGLSERTVRRLGGERAPVTLVPGAKPAGSTTTPARAVPLAEEPPQRRAGTDRVRGPRRAVAPSPKTSWSNISPAAEVAQADGTVRLRTLPELRPLPRSRASGCA